jgi:hypothetical protein
VSIDVGLLGCGCCDLHVYTKVSEKHTVSIVRISAFEALVSTYKFTWRQTQSVIHTVVRNSNVTLKNTIVFNFNMHSGTLSVVCVNDCTAKHP